MPHAAPHFYSIFPMRRLIRRRHKPALIALALALILPLAMAVAIGQSACPVIDDLPMDIQITAAPANIMFLIDDSGSMDWEFMTSSVDGKFNAGSGDDIEYLHEAGDNYYPLNDQLGDLLGVTAGTRAMWKATWHGYNKLYYNPAITYRPWPKIGGTPDDFYMDDADTTAPASSPWVWNAEESDGENAFALDTIYHTFTEMDHKGFIMDKGGDTGAYTEDGTWDDTGYNQESSYGQSITRYTNVVGDTASWQYDFQEGEGGTYHVQGYWACYSNRDKEAEFTITAADGDHEVIINQRDGQGGTCGEWMDLGEYAFNDGEAGVVRARRAGDNNNKNGTSTAADAIRFINDAQLAEEATATLSLDIIQAHYYAAADNGDIYLVNLTDPVAYYKVSASAITDDSNNALSYFDFSPTLTENVPENIAVDYATARQSFANWFTYHRRRYLTTINAISTAITNLGNVYVGLAGVNSVRPSSKGGIAQDVLPLGIGGVNQRDALLQALYGYDHISGQASTPLRDALVQIGRYFDRTDGADKKPNPDPQFRLGTSPIQTESGACQQNFVIVFTDGYYNGGAPGVQNIDSDVYTTKDGTVTLSGIPPYADNSPGTLADVAMYYYVTDLAPEVEDMVPTRFPDMAEFQHLVTYMITFGVHGNLDPDNILGTDPPTAFNIINPATYPDNDECDPWCWPNINAHADYRSKIDDMWHAAINGRGEFHSADDPEELLKAFESVVMSILDRIGSGASASLNSEELRAGSLIFQSGYNTEGWAGFLSARAIAFGQAGYIDGQVIPDALWDAAAKLLETVGDDGAGHEDRLIATFRRETPAGGIPFRFNSLDTAQQALLTAAQVDYIRGDVSGEIRNGGAFRNRLTRNAGSIRQSDPFILGDIVHSSPAYSDGVVFAGANDGMLHAFNAETGAELFAYVPSLVFPNLASLTDPQYSHLYFVDSTPYIRPITDAADNPMTLLVCGLGKGGKGYFALNVSGLLTDAGPAISSESDLDDRALWEFPAPSAPVTILNDVGYSLSNAYIARSHDADHPWIVIFGNGYQSQDDSAVLFVLDARTGQVLAQLDTGATGCNGLSTPLPADVNNDAVIDYAYAGDLRGNLWKFDLTAASADEWAIAYHTNLDSGAPMPLFRALDAGGNPQPITAKPNAIAHCDEHGSIVIFGTGRYMGGDDLSNVNPQTVYGVWDYGDNDDDTEYLGNFQRNATPRLSNQPDTVTLLEQTAIMVEANGNILRVMSNHEPVWITEEDDTSLAFQPEPRWPDPSSVEANHAGWFFDLPTEGERLVREVLIRDGKAIFVTIIPQSTSGPCGSGAISYLHEIDACSGARLSQISLDINNDSEITTEDMVIIDNPEFNANEPVGPDNQETIEVPVSGMQFPDIVQPPAVIITGGAEVKYLTGPGGTITPVWESGGPSGMIYWRDVVQ